MKPRKKFINIRYTLAELFMITLGVSIALFFQFWYEESKEHELEEKMLKEILTNLNDDITELENIVRSDTKTIKNVDSVLSLIANNTLYYPSIDTLIARSLFASPFYPNIAGYETIKNLGLNLIRNDTLRIQITNLYELTYPNKKYIFDYKDDYWIEASASFFIQHFEQYSFYSMHPNDFEALKKNKVFKALLLTNSDFRKHDISYTKGALRDAKKVAASIETYLSTL